jgi:hypothetical protein
MPSKPLRWPDGVHEIITGDLTAAAAYVTPAGGAVVTGVAPCGFARREDGVVGFTTSLAFSKKLERILRDPCVALAFNAREHGFSSADGFVLAQGRATVDLRPSPERLDAFVPQAERYVGDVKRGVLWDRLLREYYFERVFVDIAVERIVAWPDLGAFGDPDVIGPALPDAPPAQAAPKHGAGPRVDVSRTAGQLASLPHRVLAYRGIDGLPVVVPVHLAGHDGAGLRLVVAPRQLPPGGRRAGLLAHAYRPHLVGLRTRVLTGWLDVDDRGLGVYAPHTSKGFAAPPQKEMLLLGNGLLAKFLTRRALRQDRPATLERLAQEHAHSPDNE